MILFLVIFWCSFCGGIIMTSTCKIVGHAQGAGLREDNDEAGEHDLYVRKDLW